MVISAGGSGLRGVSRRVTDGVILILVIIAVWEVIYWAAGAIALSSPFTAAAEAYQLLASEDFWPNVFSSFRALAIALVIEVVLGLAFGVACGLNRTLGEVWEPIIVGFYSIPKIVFYPIVLMFCGIGLASVVVFAVMHGILPIILFTMNAVRSMKPIYLKAARVMRLGRLDMMWRIALPAAIPEVFTGLRIGFGATLVGVLLSEMFGSKSGLGFMLMNAIGLNLVNEITALTLLLAGFAVLVNLALLHIDRRLHRRF
jgi:NitT/TauT family transport system permease protein